MLHIVIKYFNYSVRVKYSAKTVKISKWKKPEKTLK